MADQTREHQGSAPAERRAAGLEAAFEEEWVPRNGARVVARAWTDPAFRRRLLDNGRDAVR